MEVIHNAEDRKKGQWLKSILTKEVLEELYINQRKTTAEIAVLANTWTETVRLHLKRHNIQRRAGNWVKKYTDSPRFENFLRPMNDWYAYWLGFIAADGCVFTKAYSSMVRIGLNIKEKAHLENLKNGLGVDNPIFERSLDKSPNVRIEFHSKRLVEVLATWGINQNKTHNFQFPNTMPADLIPSFIRGYFDGDGTVYYRDRGSYGETVCRFISGSLKFLEELSNYLATKGIKSNRLYRNGKSNAFVLPISGRKDNLSMFANLIYAKNGFALERKKDYFKKFMEMK